MAPKIFVFMAIIIQKMSFYQHEVMATVGETVRERKSKKRAAKQYENDVIKFYGLLSE